MPPALQSFVLIFLAGALLRSLGLLTKAHAERLASVVFSVSLPATILISLDRVVFDAAAWKVPAAACLVTLPLIACSWLIARLLRLGRVTRGSFLVATGCINSVYFSYPVTLAAYGETGLGQAVLFDLGQTALTLTVIYGLAVWHGTGNASSGFPLVRLAISPPLWALAVVLALKAAGLSLPEWARLILAPLHLTTTPLASLVLGLSISLTAVRQRLLLAMLGVVVRMGGGLLLGFVAAFLLQLHDLPRAVVVMIAAMPSAVTAVIFATEAGLDEDLVASVVALSICLGVALLPFLPHLSHLLGS